MILSNLSYIDNKELETINIVEGVCVFSKNVGKDIMASFKNVVGGEIKSYSEMVRDVKDTAVKKMVEEAKNLGADAVINIRYAMTSMSQGSTLAVIVSGTEVKVKGE
ncbi:UPF0145 protein [Clostridium tetani]|uniref:UPF0145 protein K234311028_14890 n=1 Tax=Clostridium tetani TaxID=1513 RepID=A0ABC8EDG7_CLOTA|nr:YbjQ family protein [Clostridium tetani]BDR81243.1 UPF0145 protein [Clostridium tetani]BDR89622.1 UPF0145 protein [Clostridium tetani]